MRAYTNSPSSLFHNAPLSALPCPGPIPQTITKLTLLTVLTLQGNTGVDGEEDTVDREW